jgi:hypothetical protein
MTDDTLQALKKDAAKKKRVASEWAGQLHDLVEDKLPNGYEQLPELAQSTFDACKAAVEAERAYQQAKGE